MNSSDLDLQDKDSVNGTQPLSPIVLNFTKSNSNQTPPVVLQPILNRDPSANVYEALQSTQMTINLFDFAIVIFYVLLIVFLVSMSYTLRKEIKVVVVRVLSILGLLQHLRELKRSCLNLFRSRTKEEIQEQEQKNKVKQ